GAGQDGAARDPVEAAGQAAPRPRGPRVPEDRRGRRGRRGRVARAPRRRRGEESLTESLGGWRRSHSCGALRSEPVGQVVTLMGWASRRREHGGLVFIDLREREGLTQCVFNPSTGGAAHARAESVRSEFVLAVCGTVGARPAGTENPKLATGAVEVQV